MTLHERILLSQEYREWLVKQNCKYKYSMQINPETFLAFLENKHLLQDPERLRSRIKNMLIVNEHWFNDIDSLADALTEIDMIFEEVK